MTSSFTVELADLRKHAESCGDFGDRVAYAAEAARHLMLLDDGYGMFATPFVTAVKMVQATAALALTGMGTALEATADKIVTCADTFQELDTERGSELDGCEIGDGPR
ncbi:type VII secretion target [Nocardia puris]|uniref:Excreted virulence factor EspC (Type VII ESX diderm) n=1 Tax=Nocardia puris TaxID=208602 RepID=A0A366DC57_9NOCA|nr:type VII secretion target [Nocardia puris]RBO87525.1 excreted virulence factor EspC (type VII ESX diderm) [Nocardia puris]